jgi:hypothetical protein
MDLREGVVLEGESGRRHPATQVERFAFLLSEQFLTFLAL